MAISNSICWERPQYAVEGFRELRFFGGWSSSVLLYRDSPSLWCVSVGGWTWFFQKMFPLLFFWWWEMTDVAPKSPIAAKLLWDLVCLKATMINFLFILDSFSEFVLCMNLWMHCQYIYVSFEVLKVKANQSDSRKTLILSLPLNEPHHESVSC